MKKILISSIINNNLHFQPCHIMTLSSLDVEGEGCSYCKRCCLGDGVELAFVSLGLWASGCNRLNGPPSCPLLCVVLPWPPFSGYIICTIDNSTFLQAATLLRMPFHGERRHCEFIMSWAPVSWPHILFISAFGLTSARMLNLCWHSHSLSGSLCQDTLFYVNRRMKCCQHAVRMPLCAGWHNKHLTKSAELGRNRSLNVTFMSV